MKEFKINSQMDSATPVFKDKASFERAWEEFRKRMDQIITRREVEKFLREEERFERDSRKVNIMTRG